MNLFKRIYSKIRFQEMSSETIHSSSNYHAPNPRKSDIYLVSYPRSGNTWMRYLLAYVIWPELPNVNLGGMAPYIPDAGIDYDRCMMLDSNSLCNKIKHRIIKSHRRYNTLAKRVIYIVRDGRDMMISYWHYVNERDNTSIPFSAFLEMSQPYGPWKSHVLEWLNASLEGRLVLRYEDMLKDTASCLNKALEFAEIPFADSTISTAIERASFESMRRIEKRGIFNPYQRGNPIFMRKGVSGFWKDVFGPGELERFNKFHGGPIPEIGYIW